MNKDEQATYDYLLKKYNRTFIAPKELAAEMFVSINTVRKNMSKKIGVPNFKKLGNKPNSLARFQIRDVAIFLNEINTKTM